MDVCVVGCGLWSVVRNVCPVRRATVVGGGWRTVCGDVQCAMCGAQSASTSAVHVVCGSHHPV
jgi:hypothetical protein